jgi:acyl carrier protein
VSEQAPANLLERVIAAICREVIQVAEVSVTQDFIALGGDSLQVIEIAWRIQECLPVDVPYDLIIRQPTIRSLASSIAEYVGVEGMEAVEQELADASA